MKRKHIGLILASPFFILFLMIFRPVPIPDDAKECLVVEGIVKKIFEGGTNDIAFRLEGNNTVYYINRGLEQGTNPGRIA